MLLRSLSLRNIRSYGSGEETRLDFPEGVVLFEGDIGSGKSTLLYAVEFALFGFSDMKGAHLLSEGRREGSVSLTFESDDIEYMVERRLKLKAGNVVQDECYISSRGSRERLSPSDLKERVVSILGFNEPTHPKAESLVYRFAVFTPQEMMKEILVQSSEERLHVIRRVLGAQSYQTAAENSEVLERRLKEQARALKEAAKDYDEKEAEAASKQEEVTLLSGVMPKLRAAEADASRHTKSLEAEWRESQEERESLGKIGAKVPLIRESIAELRKGIEEDQERLSALEARLSTEFEPGIQEFESTPRPEVGVRELEEESDSLKEKLGQLTENRRTLESELSKTKELEAQRVCPTCGQTISGDMLVRSAHVEKEIAQSLEGISETESRLADVTASLTAARNYTELEKDARRMKEEWTRTNRETHSLRKRIRESSMKASKLSSELAESERRLKGMEEVSARMTDLEARLSNSRDVEKESGRAVAHAVAQLAGAKTSLESLRKDLARKEASIRKADRLLRYHSWLASFFRPTVELIEEQTLSHAASRFNEHFHGFFTSLVDDPDMVVRVKEDFSPVFERGGFEQDFAALSGGERTSMALAYRFALNTVVKESISARPQLLILDEPTDGFSREQVYKMRGLIEALRAKQVILVSHERELESMADHVFRVEKRNGASAVSRSPPVR